MYLPLDVPSNEELKQVREFRKIGAIGMSKSIVIYNLKSLRKHCIISPRSIKSFRKKTRYSMGQTTDQ